MPRLPRPAHQRTCRRLPIPKRRFSIQAQVSRTTGPIPVYTLFGLYYIPPPVPVSELPCWLFPASEAPELGRGGFRVAQAG